MCFLHRSLRMVGGATAGFSALRCWYSEGAAWESSAEDRGGEERRGTSEREKEGRKEGREEGKKEVGGYERHLWTL